MAIILSVNVGSSSVKISAYLIGSAREPQGLAEIEVSGLTAPPAKLTYSRGGEQVAQHEEIQDSITSQGAAFQYMLDRLVADEALRDLQQLGDITHVCHRVVHGGDYSRPQLITPDTYHHLEALTDLAPLHNSPALAIVRACVATLPPATRNIACFDSQFHATLPAHVRCYPIDPERARKNRLRKYGFHGISYSFITRAVADFLGQPPAATSLIALHLGSGASACAIKRGQSWDTSMGLTPLAGLPGATRSGSVDPSLVFHYASDVGKLSPSSTQDLHISQAEEILNKQAGWKSLTGTTDFGKISAAYDTDAAARLAFDMLVDRICGFIGSYYVTLGGEVDALVFAGGIGEKGAELRRRVLDHVRCLGFELDRTRNSQAVRDVVTDIGASGARHRTLVCQTDEQFEMARACLADDELFN